MSSQGPNSGSTFATVAGGYDVDWTNPGRAVASDNSYATAVCSIGTSSYYLMATQFGFAIPTGSTINGIKVEFERKASQANAALDNAERLARAGVLSDYYRYTEDYWPTTNAYQTLGSSTDLWDEAWTPDDINSTGFGVGISGCNDSYAGNLTLSIDHIRLTVYYTSITHYVLTAGAGSYTKTGQAAGLKLARKIAAAQGSYALAGQAVELRAIRKMAAGSGSYLLDGQIAALRAARRMAADPDSYSLTGQPVDFNLARKIAAGLGSYLLTGQDTVLRAIRKVAAEGGSYVYTGMDANLTLGQHYILTCEPGVYGEPYSKVFVTLDGRIYKKMGNTYLRLS